MKQLIIDRYNKGQGKFILINYRNGYIKIVTDDSKHHYTISLYDFLFNSKWGWLDTFLKDKEWKKEFWSWMEKKGYGIIHNLDKGAEYALLYKFEKYSNSNRYMKKRIWKWDKKMLIGYIMKFIEGLL